ncbi:MAG: hypothetical protein KatS3mg057_3250 [Herpetosiphonaceae bacterium]|nr:MAG: hypothetical protein KatS3mg057_3250 [Herpetosiphonaceae bacterium]
MTSYEPGERMEACLSNLPTRIITFLFTDIEGSTRLWEQHPQEMRVALARHDEIVRQALEAHGGIIFKTVGDAFHAAFSTAPAALAAAIAIQRTLLAEEWGAIGGFRVRIALHSGAAEERDGDYFGPTLNRIARLRDAAHGGQILLSLAAQQLLYSQLPPGVTLRDLGRRRLKDLAHPEHIFQVIAPGLLSDFPPLRTLDSRPTNLPASPTSLIGREREVAAISALLRRQDVRQVTLTGPAGTGKSRLALQVAADLIDDFEDGVFFVALASINDPALVLSTIAQSLGLKDVGGQPLAESLKSFLHDKEMLLLLDNFEQVVAAAPLIADLLATAPRLNVLVTSREVLRLYGEHEFPVQPLALPDPQQTASIDALLRAPAVALFVERARAVRPDFSLNAENAAAVAALCARLDGLPLAIELAAARSKLLAPQALLARLDSRLRVLTGGARDLPARQQTLRGAIAWSYDLLDEGERTLFAYLGVFIGGCTLDAAETVAGEGLPMDILDGLTSLADKSLLRRYRDPQEEATQESGTGGASEPRFMMLETIREYALECLAMSGKEEELRQRHADYFLALAEGAEPELRGPAQVTWLEQLEQEHDNLRAALQWALDSGEVEVALRIGGALGRFWLARGYLSEGRAWLTAALAAARLRQRSESYGAALAKAFNAAGNLAHTQGDYAAAHPLYQECLAIRRELGDQLGIAYVLNNLGSVAHDQGNYEQARAFYEESLTLCRELRDRRGVASLLHNRGNLAKDQGDYASAIALLEESLTLRRQLGDRWGIAMSLTNLALAVLYQGDNRRSIELCEESLAIFRDLRDPRGMAMSLNNLSFAALAQGDVERAASLSRESLALRRQLGDKARIAECLE